VLSIVAQIILNSSRRSNIATSGSMHWQRCREPLVANRNSISYNRSFPATIRIYPEQLQHRHTEKASQ
jgi:hypothetical protein